MAATASNAQIMADQYLSVIVLLRKHCFVCLM